jgi:putative copper resistance protein D
VKTVRGPRFGPIALAAAVLLAAAILPAFAAAQASSLPPRATASMPDMPGMEMPDSPGPHWTDREWSSFNHRAIGWFLFLWGATALIAAVLPAENGFRFVPPLMLFGAAEFLFVHGDPEAWPIGPVGPIEGLRDPEVLQHRVFLLLLLAMGTIELLRAAGRLPPFWRKYSLPVLAVFGAVYLFFHKHGGAATASMKMEADPAMAASMALVRQEHFWFSMFGFGLAAAKLGADTGALKGRTGRALWAVFAIALGLYMSRYTE